eukprot:m51a1_g8028 hypothetical protein (362) ;mRNA; f:22078-23799
MGRIKKQRVNEEAASLPRITVPETTMTLELEPGEARSAMDVLLAGLNVRAVDHRELTPLTAPEAWCGQCSTPVVVVRASDSTVFVTSCRRRAEGAQSPAPSDVFVFDRCRVACACPREHLGLRRVVLVLSPRDATSGHALVSRPMRVCPRERSLESPTLRTVACCHSSAAAAKAAAQAAQAAEAHDDSASVGVCLTRVGVAHELADLLVAFLRDSVLRRVEGFVSLSWQELVPGIVVISAAAAKAAAQAAQAAEAHDDSASVGVCLTRVGVAHELADLLVAFLRDSVLRRVEGFVSLSWQELVPGIVVMFARCESDEALKAVHEATVRYWKNEFGFENCLCTDLISAGLLSPISSFSNCSA